MMKMHWMKLALMVIVMAALAACGGDDGDGETGADVVDDQSAEVGADVAEETGEDVAEETGEDSTEETAEDTTEETTPPDCEDGDLRCAEDILEICEDGAWVEQSDCTDDGKICVEHTCVVPEPETGFVGAETCKTCHAGMNADVVEAFEHSGHPFKIQKVIDGQPPVYPYSEVPDFGGTTMETLGYSDYTDISYVVGGYGWKVRFMGPDGYLVTGTADNPDVQYNYEDQSWVPYHTDELKPFTCGSCHTTGWVATGEEGPHQDDLPGIHGTWVDEGVTCEACHGPGAEHAAGPSKDNIIAEPTTDESCAKCHIRGDDLAVIPASGGLIKHHEQHQEQLAGPHAALGCMACHSPHASTKYDDEAPGEGVRTTCDACHGDVTHDHTAKGATCVDCHMPKVVKSAVKNEINGVTFGDIRSHIFELDASADAALVNEEGNAATGVIPATYACFQCHEGKDAAWVETNAPAIHQ
jgi:hypothetical protein